MSSPVGNKEETSTTTVKSEVEVNCSSDISGESSENVHLKSEDIISPGDQEADSPVENQVLAQTARCFLRESFLRIQWNLRGLPADITFIDKPDIKSAEFVAFNREFDEAVVKRVSNPTRLESEDQEEVEKKSEKFEKIDLVTTSSITIDYQPKNTYSSSG